MYDDNQRELILANILNLLHFDQINPTEFNHRIIYQKVVYLLQYIGISLGYRFNWYIRGPYSPLLTKTLYNLAEDPVLQETGRKSQLKNQAEIAERIANLQEVIRSHHNDAIFLEILASMAYIRRSNPQKYRDTTVIERLYTLKPFIQQLPGSPEICREALDILNSLEN